ncbi:MAG: hypothetical protein ACRECV_12665 [Xanthobacteraceae bacterium]
MKDSTGKFGVASGATARRSAVLATIWLLAVGVLSATTVYAQNGEPLPAKPAAVPQSAASTAPGAAQPGGAFPAQPAPTGPSGFIYAFGHWWDSTRGKIDDLKKQSDGAGNGAVAATQDILKNAAEATKKAATAIVKLPAARFVEVHRRCPIAPNGAPDCGTAAANACRVKGFNGGNPVNVQSSENCPPAVWMSGREPAPGECPSETVVLMAACN